MEKLRTGWGLLALCLTTAAATAVTACGPSALGRVNYQAQSPASGGPRSLEEVKVFHVECKSPKVNGVGCTYQGQPAPWTILGVFRIPDNAQSRWPEYEDAVRAGGAKEGCPAVAIRSDPPGMGEQMGRSWTYSEAIGAFCINPTATTDVALTPQASASAPPPVAPAVGADAGAAAAADSELPAPDAGAPSGKPSKKKKKKK